MAHARRRVFFLRNIEFEKCWRRTHWKKNMSLAHDIKLMIKIMGSWGQNHSKNSGLHAKSRSARFWVKLECLEMIVFYGPPKVEFFFQRKYWNWKCKKRMHWKNSILPAHAIKSMIKIVVLWDQRYQPKWVRAYFFLQIVEVSKKVFQQKHIFVFVVFKWRRKRENMKKWKRTFSKENPQNSVFGWLWTKKVFVFLLSSLSKFHFFFGFCPSASFPKILFFCGGGGGSSVFLFLVAFFLLLMFACFFEIKFS